MALSLDATTSPLQKLQKGSHLCLSHLQHLEHIVTWHEVNGTTAGSKLEQLKSKYILLQLLLPERWQLLAEGSLS